MMIKNDDVNEQLSADWAHKVIATDVKRVIIPIPQGAKGQNVEYTEWDGSKAEGNGFLFSNETDKRPQFVSSSGGIIIGHEGECPEGPNGTMIMRSEAIDKYFAQHPNAMSDETHIAQTIKYLQAKVFRHAEQDPTQWDGNMVPDLWTSDVKWLAKNFNEKDIYNPDGSVRSVISAAKKTEIESDVVYFGPNLQIEGKGKTGDRGSWAIRKPDGVVDLCTEEVFNKTYKHSGERGKARFVSSGDMDVEYPKGSMRYMPPRESSSAKVTLDDRITGYKKRCSELETPVFRVLGAAMCNYLEQHQTNTIGLELEINGLMYMDGNELSATSTNPKSNFLKPLLEEKCIDDKGRIINPTKFAESNLIKNYKGKGIDFSQTQTIEKLKNNKSAANRLQASSLHKD